MTTKFLQKIIKDKDVELKRMKDTNKHLEIEIKKLKIEILEEKCKTPDDLMKTKADILDNVFEILQAIFNMESIEENDKPSHIKQEDWLKMERKEQWFEMFRAACKNEPSPTFIKYALIETDDVESLAECMSFLHDRLMRRLRVIKFTKTVIRDGLACPLEDKLFNLLKN